MIDSVIDGTTYRTQPLINRHEFTDEYVIKYQKFMGTKIHLLDEEVANPVRTALMHTGHNALEEMGHRYSFKGVRLDLGNPNQHMAQVIAMNERVGQNVHNFELASSDEYDNEDPYPYALLVILNGLSRIKECKVDFGVTVFTRNNEATVCMYITFNYSPTNSKTIRFPLIQDLYGIRARTFTTTTVLTSYVNQMFWPDSYA